MTKLISKTFALIGFCCALAVTSVSAQTGALKADIPFAFHVSNKALPAGEYKVHTLSSQPGVIAVSSTDGKNAAVALRRDAVEKGTPEKSIFVFRRYGNTYFLAHIITQGQKTGSELPMSKTERRLMQELPNRHLAEGKATPEYVTVTASVE